MAMWPELYLSYLYVYEAPFTIWTPPEFPDILQYFSLPTPPSLPTSTSFEPTGPLADWRYYLYWRAEWEEPPLDPATRVAKWSEYLQSTTRTYHSLPPSPSPIPNPIIPPSLESPPFDPTSIVDAICSDQPSSSSQFVDVDAIMTDAEEPPQTAAPPPTAVVTPTPVAPSPFDTPQQLRDT